MKSSDRMFCERDSSSILDLEAADYFKLDPAQFHLMSRRSNHSGSRTPKDTSTMGLSKTQLEDTSLKTKQNGLDNKPKCRRHIEQRQNLGIKSSRHPDSKKSITRSDGSQRIRSINKKRAHGTSIKFIGSSTTSTNSLPSISSSPSVSPSLICPHLSLSDILDCRYDSKSPHTIGLCEKCRLDPPPYIQSPLSPVFKPSNAITNQNMRYDSSLDQSINEYDSLRVNHNLQRGTSDYHEIANSRRKQLLNRKARDDSLDCYLDPGDMRRYRMSPTLRHSVEFIRKYSTEVGRVLKVYKNGQPYEKPLRICITRDEFANLNNLLDHINSRQLIPCGARYLFHLDGQLVYSVNELKHGSTYIVSGTRAFDVKASSIIKEQQKKELSQAHHLNEQLLQRRLVNRRIARSLNSISDIRDDGSRGEVKSIRSITEMGGQEELSRRSRDNAEKHCIKRHDKTSSYQAAPRVQIHKQCKSIQVDEKLIDQGTSIDRSVKEGPVGADRKSKANHSQQTNTKSRSSENLNQTSIFNDNTERRPKSFNRARSEMSSSSLKRKKNVTFMDTGRMSSPVMRRAKETHVEVEIASRAKTPEAKLTDQVECFEYKPSDKTMSTNEIGIQVSDSIDGYLIDLPLPLPARGEEEREQQSKRKFNSTNRPTIRKRVGYVSKKSNGKAHKSGQIVTITEKDLSTNELDQLKDLDHGDHHQEKNKIDRVFIKLDSVDEAGSSIHSDDKTEMVQNNHDEEEEERQTIPDRAGTINIGQTEDSSAVSTKPPMTRTKETSTDDRETGWQYPGGRKGSTTPIERPVSQSEANEMIHARVTTPTPSLSTVGDNNSLSMSYDGKAPSPMNEYQMKRIKRKMPEKVYVPVIGKLYPGVNIPDKNFKLSWINGFTINDQYPENSISAANTIMISASQSADHSSPHSSPGRELLSPSQLNKDAVKIKFKPSERFHNWICYSKLHDELIYPAGSLVVLWCRWTNKQRFYSRHQFNITSLTISSTGPDIVASAEVGSEDRSSAASVHLWSITKLETLMLIEDNYFKSSKIYSMKLRFVQENNWSLLVGAKDDKKQLYLLSFRIKIANDTRTSDQRAPDIKAKQTKLEKNLSSPIVVVKANKLLQPNQAPLLVTHVPIEQTSTSGQGEQKNPNTSKDYLLTFGRRHFQLLSHDWQKQKLNSMQLDNKSSEFVDGISNANCLARLTPNEFLVGDQAGFISLITISIQQTTRLLKIGSNVSQNKHSVGIIRLVNPNELNQPEAGKVTARSKVTSGCETSITSLTRISGNIFVSSDSNFMIRFWKIQRSRRVYDSADKTTPLIGSDNICCRQLTCISLPSDLGFVCSIVVSGFHRKQSMVEFYAVSSSNAILFGSIQLQLEETTKGENTSGHSSLSIVYEGHETSVMHLVADSYGTKSHKKPASLTNDESIVNYFTCSLDSKICKWIGKNLVWKSILPSACVSLAVHPTGSVLAIGSADGTIYVLDKISGLLISYFPLTPVCINCLAYSCDGSLLAAGCANGSIFMLPVLENGLKYKKVSIFQSPFPVVSMQFSLDSRYLLTSVTHSLYQELLLWDLPNFRYMRDNVKLVADKIDWFEPICSGSEDVRAIWENVNLPSTMSSTKTRLMSKRPSTVSMSAMMNVPGTVVNLSCDRLVPAQSHSKINNQDQSQMQSLCIASDTRGNLRLFNYPCRDIEQGFYEAKVTSSPVNCCKFLATSVGDKQYMNFVSSSLDGSIFLWKLED